MWVDAALELSNHRDCSGLGFKALRDLFMESLHVNGISHSTPKFSRSGRVSCCGSKVTVSNFAPVAAEGRRGEGEGNNHGARPAGSAVPADGGGETQFDPWAAGQGGGMRVGRQVCGLDWDHT